MSGKQSNLDAIARRRRELRGNRSIREVCRDQYELDREDGVAWFTPIRNRKSWARTPLVESPRMSQQRKEKS